MTIADADRLRSIKTFPSLVKYLREELDWPIASDDFDDLTFDYEPEELGLDSQSAVKIREIKQLRPLTSSQPWGIFFVNFEPKRLPVVVLRRILRSLVIKKRQSANKSQQAAWQSHDLLFISAYGEADHRDITLANFFEGEDNGDLPTLRVLGWDDEDTVLHLTHAHEVLRERLHWPKDPTDVVRWRQTWSAAFTLRHRQVITTSRDLAVRMAELATAIRKRANSVLAVESENGPLRRLMKAFRETLIRDLSGDDFADMYAQTITYGLLSARVSRPMGLVAENIKDMVPVTNPFLQDLLAQFLTVGGRKGQIDFDELGINEVVQALRDANMGAVLRDFGDRNPQEDPVVHFYELFLKEYDPKKRMQRGVFYTPRPVVSFIVRSVHELLQSEFGIEEGLASTVTWGEMTEKHPGCHIPTGIEPSDPFVVVLDPAVGTATFLVEIIDVIYRTLAAKWTRLGLDELQQRTAWNPYVPKHLLPRLYGYELMMAPYAIAHMKVGLKLYETGYCFASHERARIYLTNALEPCMTQIPLIGFDALAHEAAAVNEIKRHTRFTVVIANPPYAVHSANESRDSLGRPTFIGRLIEDYKQVDGKPLREKNPKVIQDDYVKFIRFSQWSISQTGLGIVGMITNHSYLDNLTFRGMRQSLLSSFKDIRVCDLHGNANKKELPPNREIDENVFDIKQGVALFLGLQKLGSALSNHVWHSEMWGTRKTKYEQLVDKSSSTLSTQKLQSLAPFFLFIPQGTAVRSEYEQGIQLAAVFLLNSSCMNTARDHLVIDCSEDVLRERIAWMADPRVSVQEIREKFGIESTGWWSLDEAITALRATPDWRHLIIRCLYRPFDVRWLFHHTAFIDRPRPRANRHMLLGNISLVTTRQTKEPFAAVVTNLICGQHKIAAVYDRSYFFPLFTFQESRDFQPIVTSEAAGRPNLSPAFLGALGTALKLPQEGAYGMPKGLSPEDIFQYAYSVFHSTGYRSRYAELLKIDFPRLPLTRNLHLFCALARLGGELVALHVLASSRLDNFLTSYTGAANPEVEKIFRSGDAVWLDKAQTCGFCGVPQDAWEFHIGGYQVCEKWLKDRKGRTLSAQDIEHYHRIVVALSETIRLMREIDEVIDQHGGWPLA